ncbi:MAG: FliM/FliN family flagellar motor switch protein [Rhizobiaceae bacterium]|jgi:flagellar motor switch/type III secretory pathway protein FliN|nr:FliM/FliN family flagellar motor switch protein [Rhizobiaceae bacterium]
MSDAPSTVAETAEGSAETSPSVLSASASHLGTFSMETAEADREAQGLAAVAVQQASEPVPAFASVPASVPASGSAGLGAVLGIPIALDLVFATVQLPVSRLMALTPGGELDLGPQSGNEVTLTANGVAFAIGELMITDEASQRVGVRILRLIGADTTVPGASGVAH